MLCAQFCLEVLFCPVAPFLYSWTKKFRGPRRLAALNMHECCSEVSDTGIASVWAHSAWPLAVPWPAHHEGCRSVQFLKFALCSPPRFLLSLCFFFCLLQNLSIVGLAFMFSLGSNETYADFPKILGCSDGVFGRPRVVSRLLYRIADLAS